MADGTGNGNGNGNGSLSPADAFKRYQNAAILDAESMNDRFAEAARLLGIPEPADSITRDEFSKKYLTQH
ncbi:MAG TPA: hypothetical protein VIC35_10610 [Acidimicrobiia bacterium]